MAPRLLVIDDEEPLLFLAPLILESEGYGHHLGSSGLPPMVDPARCSPAVLLWGDPGGKSDQQTTLLQARYVSLLTSALSPMLSLLLRLLSLNSRTLSEETQRHVESLPGSASSLRLTERMRQRQDTSTPAQARQTSLEQEPDLLIAAARSERKSR